MRAPSVAVRQGKGGETIYEYGDDFFGRLNKRFGKSKVSIVAVTAQVGCILSPGSRHCSLCCCTSAEQSH